MSDLLQLGVKTIEEAPEAYRPFCKVINRRLGDVERDLISVPHIKSVFIVLRPDHAKRISH